MKKYSIYLLFMVAISLPCMASAQASERAFWVHAGPAATITAKLNPLVIQAGLSYRF